jgi:PAS domain S-box-containing protein
MSAADIDQDCERYRTLVESSADGVVLADDSVIVFLNAAAARLFGSAHKDQLLGRSLRDLFHVSSQAAILEQLRALRSGETRSPIEARIVRVDGGERDVEVTTARFAAPDAATLQLTVRDITDRRRAEAELRANEERLTLAFGGAQEGVWDWDLATGNVVYSARWKEMLGYSNDEIGPHVRAWEELLHPDDNPRAQALYDDVLRGERRYEAEFRLRHKEGHYITVLTRGLAVRSESDGRVVRIVGTHLDITQQKRIELQLRESEERLRLAFEGAQEGVWDWNLESNAVVYSPRWKQMLGYSEDEIEPHVSAWERLVHPDDKARAREGDEKVGRGETYEAEFRLRHKAGHYVHVLSRGFPIRRDPGGPVVRIVGTHFDLTERKRIDAERARTELLTRLVFAQEDERRRIARDMHDQFGEQLTALSLQIGRLKAVCAGGAAGASEMRGELDALDAIARRLDDDVDELIWQLRPTALDDFGLRAALTNYMQGWSERTHIPARLHESGLLHQRLPSEIETTLYRIAQEALNNVAKHASAQHVDVILERRADTILLIVEDDGRGFEPGGHGGGFGLVSMRERAALVGASLEIESSPGQGTTVIVRIADTSSRSGAEDHV